jgi:hypothetical protein
MQHTVKQPELSLQLSALVSRVGTGVAAPLLRLLVDGLAEKAVESAPCARALDGLLRHLPTVRPSLSCLERIRLHAGVQRILSFAETLRHVLTAYTSIEALFRSSCIA